LSSERGKTVSVKDSIEEYLDKYALREKFNLSEIKSIWAGAMGQTIAKRTEKMFYRDGKLLIKIESAALKHQLHMERTKIKERLNEVIGKQYVSEVVFL
jgi:hypothetical protein